jgi:hypothetical protein
MIEKTFKNFDIESDEGKMLLASIAILTSISISDIQEKKYGSTCSPEDVIDTIQDLANRIFHEKEWKRDQMGKKRIEKINKLENELSTTRRNL